MQVSGINDVTYVQELYKEMVSTVLENGLEGELEDEFGYSKYDYRNKETDNSRNGYSEKTLKSRLGGLGIILCKWKFLSILLVGVITNLTSTFL